MRTRDKGRDERERVSCDDDKGERQRREGDWDFERVRKKSGLSCNSVMVMRERGKEESEDWGRSREWLREGFRVRKRLRVIFERGLKKGGTMPYRGKKRVERRCFRAETRQPFEPVTVHKTRRSDHGPDGSMLFLHGTVPYLKQTLKLNSSRVSQSDCTVQSGFNNLALK